MSTKKNEVSHPFANWNKMKITTGPWVHKHIAVYFDSLPYRKVLMDYFDGVPEMLASRMKTSGTPGKWRLTDAYDL